MDQRIQDLAYAGLSPPPIAAADLPTWHGSNEAALERRELVREPEPAVLLLWLCQLRYLLGWRVADRTPGTFAR